jgi:hypothetical protein
MGRATVRGADRHVRQRLPAFGMMVQVLFTGSLGIWPEDANSDLAGTWQDINNIACSNP